jgi:hypothetical protein
MELNHLPPSRRKRLEGALPMSYARMVWGWTGIARPPPRVSPRRSTLSYTPANSTQKRKRREVAAQFSFPSRGDTEGHELAVERFVGLEDRRECHGGSSKIIGELHEVSFRRNRKANREGTCRKISGARLASRVDDLSCLHPPWEVAPHDDVVRQRVACDLRLFRDGVLRRDDVASTCARR